MRRIEPGAHPAEALSSPVGVVFRPAIPISLIQPLMAPRIGSRLPWACNGNGDVYHMRPLR